MYHIPLRHVNKFDPAGHGKLLKQLAFLALSAYNDRKVMSRRKL